MKVFTLKFHAIFHMAKEHQGKDPYMFTPCQGPNCTYCKYGPPKEMTISADKIYPAPGNVEEFEMKYKEIQN